MRVLAATRGDAASYYRIEAPFSILSYRGLDVEIRGPAAEDAGKFDVLWLHMHAGALVELVAREFQAAGGKVVYDVDDWVFEIPPSWPAYDHYFQRGYGKRTDLLSFHERLIELADAVTTTTPYLKSKLLQRFPSKRVTVLPNCVMAGDWDILSDRGHDRDGPVLGWFGTGNHWDDWMEIVDAVAEALENVDGYLALLGAPEYLACFSEELRERTLLHPLVPMATFSQVRELMKPCDVGLAWATDRLEASRCRSPLKALQWGAAGVPLVASTMVYGEDPDYLTASTPNFLRRMLECALSEARLEGREIRARAERWQRRVFAEHSYEMRSDLWGELLQSIVVSS